MIKFERKTSEKARLAIKSLQIQKEKSGTYNTKEVNAALQEMFFGKCYLCENKEITSYQIEHLHPHKGNIELKYDWNNLFLSCAHCNNIKSDKYEPILDCSKEPIDEIIAFKRSGYFGTQEKLEFFALDERIETKNTVKLLQEVYYGTTPQKKMEAKIIRKKLRQELSKFKEYIREYQEAEGEDKEDLLYAIKKELKESSLFTAFKRWLLRENKEYYSELIKNLK